MKTYLVFEPAEGGRGAEAADHVIFLREKFSWLALLFAPLWLLWHRLWLGFFCWLVAVVLIGVVAYILGLGSRLTSVAMWLPSLVIAFEGSELRRRKLMRRGFRDVGVAVGAALEDAERRFFAAWADRPAPRNRAQSESKPAPSAPMPLGSSPVIGLFPEPGGGR